MAENDINLAALWIPVLPDASKMGEGLRRAGEEGKRSFLEGFGMSDIGSQMGSGILDGLKGSELTGGMTTMLAGGLAGVVSAFTEYGLNLIDDAFEKTIDLAKDFGEQILEIGDYWETLSRQVSLSTDASGEDLEAFKRTGMDVLSTLDTSGKNLGTTLGTLATRLGLSADDPTLKQLTHDVMELSDRFGQINVGNLSADFEFFKVSAADADSVLASWTQSAREAAVSLPDLVNVMKDAGPTLAQMGLNAQQSGKFIAELQQHGINAQKAITGFNAVEKLASKDHETFAQGLQDLAGNLQKLGDTAEGQQAAFEAFGTRNWAQALSIIQNYLDTVNAVPGAFDASSGSIQTFVDSNQTLENHFDALKNKAYALLEPFGTASMEGLSSALDHFSQYVTIHHDQIVGKIKDFGDSFIRALPSIQTFAVDAVQILGPMLEVLDEQVGTFLMSMSMLTQGMAHLLDFAPPWVKLIPGFNDFKKSVDDAGKAFGDAGEKMIKAGPDIQSTFANLATTIQNQKIDVDGLASSWDNATQSMMNVPSVGQSLGKTLGTLPVPAAATAPSAPPPAGTPGNWFPSSGSSPIPGLGKIPLGVGGMSPGGRPTPGRDFLDIQPPSNDAEPAPQGVQAAINLAQGASGQPYGYGGVGDAGHGGLYDCSGFMSSIYAAITGQPYGGNERYFTTESDFTKLGFIPTNVPVPGAFNIGVHNGGGGENSHMAGTLPNGVNVESGGAADMTQYGGSAAGAWSSEFEKHYYLPTNGVQGMDYKPGYGPKPMSQYDVMKQQDEQQSRQEAIDRAQREIGKTSDEITKRKAELDKLNSQVDALGHRKASDDQIANAQTALNDAITSHTDAEKNLTKAQRQAYEESIKPPAEQKYSSQRGSGLESDSQKFGSGFLKGIFSDLGFGNVLGGKSPLDWGITKLFGGLAGWGLGEANAWGDALSGGAPTQGLNMPGPGGSILSGALDAIPGMKGLMPHGGIALGPSSVATPMANPNGSIAQGQGPGPAPGPVTYDNRIQVSGNTMVDPHQLVPPMQEQMNAGTASRASTGLITTGPGGG